MPEITRHWRVSGPDDSRSFNIAQVKRKAALQIVRDFAYSEFTKRTSPISHNIIKADEYGVCGYSSMTVS